MYRSYRNPEDIHLDEYQHNWDGPLRRSRFGNLPGAAQRGWDRQQRAKKATTATAVVKAILAANFKRSKLFRVVAFRTRHAKIKTTGFVSC